MKSNLTVLLSSFLVLILFHSKAQTAYIKGGLHLADQTSKSNADSFNDVTKINAGFHLGFSYDLLIVDGFSIEPGLMVNTKGTRIESEGASNLVFIERFNAIYVDLPIYLKHTTELNNSTSFYVAGGAYIGIGVGGRIRPVLKRDGTRERLTSRAIRWGEGEENSFKPLDAGVSLGAGLQFSEFGIGTYYDLGLVNIAATDENGATIKNRVFRLSLTYRMF